MPGWDALPCYTVLVDIRDRETLSVDLHHTERASAYSPEGALERLHSSLIVPESYSYFRFFAEDVYVPEPALQRLYPDDTPAHYRDLDAVVSTPRGFPLLRVRGTNPRRVERLGCDWAGDGKHGCWNELTR